MCSRLGASMRLGRNRHDAALEQASLFSLKVLQEPPQAMREPEQFRPAPAPRPGATQLPPEAEEAVLHTERGMVAASASTSTAVCGRPMRPQTRIMPKSRTRHDRRSTFDAPLARRGDLIEIPEV